MHSKTRKVASLLAVVVMLATVTGCHKWRAENTVKKTAATLSEIEQKYDGLTHEPDRIATLKTRLDDAKNQLEADASQALSLANQARTEADLIVESVRPKQANVLLSKANDEKRVADINDLARRDPPRFTRINEILADAQLANSENKWDDVIRFSQEAINEVATGLRPLITELDRKRLDANDALTELLQVGGNTYAAEVVFAVNDDIKTAERIAEKDRDYQLATIKFADAITKAERGYVAVLREKSRLALESIEGHLSIALLEGAETYKDREYNDALALFTNLNENYISGSFSTVLEGSEILEPRAKRLVIETKRAASDDRIVNLERSIRDLETGSITLYLPDSLDRLKEMLVVMRETRTADDEPSFDKVKTLYAEAADETDRVRELFNGVAETRIRNSRGSLETTRQVFEEMDRIFLPIEGEMTAEEKAFDNQKQSRQLQLRGQIRETELKLASAEIRQQEGSYHNAIELSDQVLKESESILSAVYHVVAHNGTIELAKLITRYDREGAGSYAPEERVRSTAKVEEVKALIAAGSYQEAVEVAAEGRAEIELMAQRIANRANDDLRNAEIAFTSASSENTRLYQAENLARVGVLIEEAKEHLKADRIGSAVDVANQAIKLAKDSETEANKQAARVRIEAAEKRIVKAQEAGAELYAGRSLEDARKLLGSARSLYTSEDFVKSEELADSSTQRAESALYRLIDEAEAEIAAAKSVGGWEYDDSRLALASTRVRDARAKLDNNQYSESRSLAESAASSAKSLSRDAKRNDFQNRIARIRTNLDAGSRQGINFFQPEESIEIRRELSSLQNRFRTDDYEAIIAEVEKLEAKLRITLDQNDALVMTVAQQQESRLQKFVEEGADSYAAVEVRTAQDNLRFARLDFDRGRYTAAHTSLTNAISLINEIEFRQAQENYSKSVQDLFDQYRDAQLAFSNILSLDPAELKELAVGVGGATQSIAISSQSTPAEFRAKVDRLYAEALLIKAPKGLENLHESVLQAFVEARIAALNFEKLTILNRVAQREANLLIEQAYIRMNNSNRIIASVQTQLISDEVRFRLVNNSTSNLVR